MTAKRTYLIMWIVLGLSIFGVGFSAFIGNQMMHKRSDELVEAKLESRSLDEQRNAFSEATAEIEKYSELNEIAKAVVPQDKDQANSVREIVKIAMESGVKISTINFPASSLAANSKGETQVKKVDGIPGVYELEITIQQEPSQPITYPALISFLTNLEHNRRTAQVTNITVQPTAKDRNKLTFSLVLSAYIKP
jgi:hypothetical protein